MNEDFTEERAFVFGDVVTVKPIPTRGVSQIIIEIPEESHVRATELLFRKNAFIFAGAANASMPFGIGRLGEDGMSMLAEGQPGPSGQSGPRNRQQQSGGFSITKWLALRCKEDEFQTFLDCRNEAQAIDKVRQICGVESRADIEKDESAKQIFTQSIFDPFNSRPMKGFSRSPWKPV